MDLSRFAYTSKEEVKEKPIIKPLIEGQLPVLLEPGLRCVFVGFNPGIESAKQGHYYAHRSNRFWKVIYKSGLVTRPVVCTDDQRLQKEYRYGFTDLVGRSTKGINQLSRLEMRQGAFELEARIANVRPAYVCLVGKGIWQAVAKALNWSLPDFEYGLQPQLFGHAKLFVVPSTSGLVSMNLEIQLKLWRQLAGLIKALEQPENEHESENDQEPENEPEPENQPEPEPEPREVV